MKTTAPFPAGWNRWTGLWRRSAGRHPVDPVSTDAIVAAWKAAWLKGAEGGWRAEPSNANPYSNGQERSAWDAGWRWAQKNPDRRTSSIPRLAHPHRRAVDTTVPLKRALQLSAAGVTVFWVSRTLHRWARRR
jgi:hypothetical protein